MNQPETPATKADVAALESKIQSEIELRDDLQKDANKVLFNFIHWLANVYLDTSVKADAVDEVLKGNPDFRKPYFDALQTMKSRDQHSKVAVMLEDLRKTLRVPL